MKKSTAYLLLVILSLFLQGIANAQNFESMPDGEGIISIIEVQDGSSAYFCAVTPHEVYQVRNINTAPILVPMLSIKEPAISDVTIQRGSTGNTFYVLLTDGTISKLHFANSLADPLTTLGNFNSADQDSPFSIVGGDNIYLTTVAGRIYVSRDNAATWQIDSTGLNGAIVGVNNQDNNFIKNSFALDNQQNIIAATSAGVYKQNKNDNNWTRILGTAGKSLVTLVIDKADGTIYAGGDYSFLSISTTGTVSFADTLGLKGQYGVADIHSANNGEIYASVQDTDFSLQSNLWRHDPVTKVWSEISKPMREFEFDPISRVMIFIDALPTSGGVILASTNYGLFVSTNNGNAWRQSEGAKAEAATGFLKLANGRKVVATNRGIFTRDPADVVWAKRFPATTYLHDIQLWADKNERLYAKDSEGTGIFVSSDKGTTWEFDTSGFYIFGENLGSAGSAGFLVDENGTEHIAVMTESLGLVCYLKNLGAPGWVSDTLGIKVADNSEGGSIFASDRKGSFYAIDRNATTRILKRNLTGGAWSVATVDIPAQLVFGIAFDKLGTLYAGTSNGIFRWNTSWQLVTPPSGLSAGESNAFTISIDSESIIWATYGSTRDSQNYSSTDLYWTKDGATWHPMGLKNYFLNEIKSYGDTTYALTDAGIAKFTAHSPGFITLSTNTLDFGTIDTNHTATQNITVTNSSDRPVTIDSAIISGSEKSNYAISHIPSPSPYIILPGNNVTYGITFSAGPAPASQKNAIFILKFGESTDSLRQTQLTGKSKIESGNSVSTQPDQSLNITIAPNPFHVSTAVNLFSALSCTARIKIADMLGKIVYSDDIKITANESHAFIFDPIKLSLPCGMYYVNVSAGNKQISKKVIFLK